MKDSLKLTVYLDERSRGADRLIDIYERHGLPTSILLRGIAGFGVHKHIHSDRQLTLSEDLPLVSIAVGAAEPVRRALADVRAIDLGGRITVETAVAPRPSTLAEAKLTFYLGRHQRIGGRPAYRVVVERLRAAGVAGATVLLGVDGTVDGVRRRARFLARNAEVPLMVISVGAGDRLAAVLPELDGLVATQELVRVCKRDGELLAEPERRGEWQKLTIYASEQAQHHGHPLYAELLRRLRAAGAAGATSLRGIWGYHGDHAPHGDTLWQLRRRVPVVTVVVDSAARIHDWFAIVDELTAETGLVTSEVVPNA